MTTELIPAGQFLPVLSLQQAIERRNMLVELTSTIMVRDVDYGVIPGTQKPTLLKPGAEKLCTQFGLTPTFEIIDTVKDWTGAVHGEPLFYFEYKCRLWRDGRQVGEGDGSCNSWEKKYRYREAQRVCPQCGQPTIFKSKREPGFYCWAKKGGCGAQFGPNDAAITGQEAGQIANPDIFDVVNTIKKMAQKRALIAATLVATNASEFFTQDVEDLYIDVQPPPPPTASINTTAVSGSATEIKLWQHQGHGRLGFRVGETLVVAANGLAETWHDLADGEPIEVSGAWAEHPKMGRYLAAETIRRASAAEPELFDEPIPERAPPAGVKKRTRPGVVKVEDLPL